ncbi:MAG: biopolymer transporter Tol [Chlorobi bacterium]|nr:biopolymer transporter Tol [Chlorobiota bacterium]MCI0716803.1 biopolymer transporter Tol [Chlorobiota bacterium]
MSKILIIFFALTTYVFAQFEPNPELDWFTIETQHFYIHYHKGTERTANLVAKIAEEIYGPITSLYNYRPDDKTSWIINDESDISNGATDYYGNRIEIAAVALDFDLRGTHNWLRNVITHEYTHVIQVQASMKFGTKFPSLYLQYLNYEKERRPDVLYGYPNVIVSYPLSGVGVPAWYAEGTAQYQRQQLGYDYWDAHRDMILRMRTLGDELLSWEDMGQFASVTTYKAESIYNSGFALVRYIADKYGEDKHREISENLGDVLRFNSEGAFTKAIGKSGSDLYNEWKAYLKQDYNERVSPIKEVWIEGEQIAKVGFANYYPQFSPDGKKISYLSNKEYDYGATSLYINYIDGKKEDEALISGVSGSYSWSLDGKKIIFSRRNKPTIHHAVIFDLFEYDIDKEKETQLTNKMRAHAPALSYDGKTLALVKNHDGTQNLFIASYTSGKKISFKDIKQLTNFTNGEQIYAPKWSPDGKHIIFDYSKQDLRSIHMINTETGEIDFSLENTEIDFRSPVYSPDGQVIFFASDKTGIFNIYKYDLLNDGRMSSKLDRVNFMNQLTNVLGGAFMPSVDSSGNLVFSSWQTTGYKINKIINYTVLDSLITEKVARYKRPEKLITRYKNETDSSSSASKNQYNWPSLKNFNDDSLTLKSYTKYNNVATPLVIIPVLRFDAYTKDNKFADYIKPGLYFYSQDVLGKMGIFGGASLNRKFERDLFLQFDYNNGVPFFKDFFLKSLSFVPRFQLAGYNVTRKTDADLVAGLDTINVDVTYDLLQFDFNMAFKVINASHNMRAGFTFSSYSSKLSTFVIPSINAQVPATSTNYFTGRDLSLSYSYSSFTPNKNDDINPIGRYFRLRYDYEINDLNPTLVVDEEGNITEEFEKVKFHRLEGDLLQGWGLFNNSHSLSLRLRGGAILGPQRDNFFDFYASGFPNMKGYPFYAIGGNRYATANLTYRFPLITHMDFNFLQFYFDKLYFSVYGDIGNAWYGKSTRLKEFKKDVGFELRLLSYSYYVYPTAFAFNAAYGIDEFSRIFPTTTNEQKLVTYGKEWRFYFTMLFGFDFLVENINKIRF